MPLPNTIHRDKALENISVAYKNGQFIASQLSPSVPVKHESDVWYTYSRDSLILPQTLRANGGEANEIDWSVSTTSYRLNEHALKSIVTDRDRANADSALKLDVDTTESLTHRILMRRERDLLDILNNPANFATRTSLTSTFAWNQATSLSNPIIFVDSATADIARATGMKANVAVLDERSLRAAKEHSNTVDRIKYTSPDSVTPQLLARLFNVESVLVSGAIQNTGQEVLSETMAFMMTDCAVVAYVERNPGLRKPSAFYTLEKQEFGNPYKVKRWREEKRDGDMIEVQTMFQHVSPASQCAYHINDTIQ